jgi:uncharacterized protein YkwD
VPVHFAFLSLLIGVALASPADSNVAEFADVYDTNSHNQAIAWMKEADIVKGYTDGTFRPDRKVNRAEAMKMIVAAKGLKDDTATCKTSSFTDVTDSDWFTPFVCIATREEWVEVTGDSPNFRPSDWINAGELSVLLARVYGFEIEKSDPWFASALRVLGAKHVIPIDVEAAGQSVSRAQLAEMLWRLQTDQKHASSADSETLIGAKCDWQPTHDIPAVDDEEVTRAWMTWVNDLRVERGLTPYSLDRQLSRTAQDWSDHAKVSGTITHKREGQSAYYDYGMMKNWFATNDLEFANANSSTFTENIGWGVYKCKQEDCTDTFINALRSTFDFYASEEGKDYRPHWNSMVNPNFRLAGVGITLDETSGKYYFTAHYGTVITSDPAPVCP